MRRFRRLGRDSSDGQGLVEYALILVLVSLVVIVVLGMTGPIIGNVFSTISQELDSIVGGRVDQDDESDPTDVLAIKRAEYDSWNRELHLDITSDGGYAPGVTLTASPGGVMEPRTAHYHLRFALSGCPCTVTVTSSAGGSLTVTVGP